MAFDRIPIMQLRDKAVLIYDDYMYSGTRYKNPLQLKILSDARELRYKGMLSLGAKKRMAKAITLLVSSSKRKWIFNEVSKRYFFHRLSFITLTVSDPTKKLTGKEAYQKLLSHFLQWLRRTKSVTTYLWKAELQENGQIHYHITTPAFINYQEIRDKWNNLQRKVGLITNYRSTMMEFHKDGFKVRHDLLKKWPYDKQLAAYKKGMAEDWQHPNSTDIHSVRKVNDMSAYMVKEICKSVQNGDSIGGKVWDCSENLKASKYFSIVMENHHADFIQKEVKEEKATQINGDRFTLVKFKRHIEKECLTAEQYKLYISFLNLIQPQ